MTWGAALLPSPADPATLFERLRDYVEPFDADMYMEHANG
jgi:hypothetical protein